MNFSQSKILPIIFLFAANVVPLLGVFAFGWTVNSILVVYWTESVIIGALNIPRIFATTGEGKPFLSLFFVVHFGMFCSGHASILTSLFGAGPEFAQLRSGGPLLWTALMFFFSHLVSLMVRLSRDEFKDKRPNQQIMAPYGRVIIMHVTVLFGGFALQVFGAPLGALILLVVLKTVVDLTAHMRESAKATLPAL